MQLLYLFLLIKCVNNIPLSIETSCILDSKFNSNIYENWEDLSNWQPEIAATGGVMMNSKYIIWILKILI